MLNFKKIIVFAICVLFFSLNGIAQNSAPLSNLDEAQNKAIWLTDHEQTAVMLYGSEVSWGFPYFAAIDDQENNFLYIEICKNNVPCKIFFLDHASGKSIFKYGVDVTQYHRGHNTFTFTLLRQQGDQLYRDTINIYIYII